MGYVECDVEFRYETNEGELLSGAFLVFDGDGDHWIPKSQVESFSKVEGKITIPEWLATEKGLI